VSVLGDNDDAAKGRTAAWEGGRFIVTFPDAEVPPAPKLGAMFDFEHPSPDGLDVKSVIPGGTCARAGIVAADTIVTLAGADVRDLTDLRWVLDAHRVGDVVDAVVQRGDARLVLPMTLAPAPAPPADAAPKP
jgi:S1-C subfamily serine protease